MSSYPSRRGSNFCRFFGLGRRKNHDILGINFVRNNCVCSETPDPVQNKIPQKIIFFGNSPRYIFHHLSFSWLCFYTVLSGWSTTFGVFSDAEKMVFFGSSERCLCGARIPYLSANNRLEPRISRDQHIQTCQFKTTNVKIHPAVPKVYTHLISFVQMEMTNAGGNFGNTLPGLRAWNVANSSLNPWSRHHSVKHDAVRMNVESYVRKNVRRYVGKNVKKYVRKNVRILSEKMSKDILERMSEDLSEDMSEKMSEDISDRVLIDTCEIMSKRYVRKCQKECQKIC